MYITCYNISPNWQLVKNKNKKAAAVCRSFITTTVREQRPSSHHKGAESQVGFEPGTNCIQFYAIANLDKTSQLVNYLNS